MSFSLTAKISKNLCPQCLSGNIFKSGLEMNESCSQCGYLIQKGSGYFVMSWFINYILSGFIVMPIFLVLIVMGYSYPIFVGIPLLVLILLQPFMIRFSRLLWIHLDYQVESKKKS